MAVFHHVFLPFFPIFMGVVDMIAFVVSVYALFSASAETESFPCGINKSYIYMHYYVFVTVLVIFYANVILAPLTSLILP